LYKNLGIQVNFTALGARLFFNRPLGDFTNRTVDLADVLESSADQLIDRLHDAESWKRRFHILDQEIASRMAAARRPADPVVWAWKELVATGGRARIHDLVREVGWSERHFATRFRSEIGLSPKAFARVLRFARAVRLLTNGIAPSLADIAPTCGYYDQAHFIRDFRAFAGTTPTALIASRFPGQAGFRADA